MNAVPPDLREQILKLLPHLRAFARSLTNNPSQADDLVQDTIVKAWSNPDKFQAGTNLRAWLFTILRNTFYSELRKRRREVEDADGVHAGRLTTSPAQVDHLSMLEFKSALSQLNQQQREALILTGASGFSCEEAASICGCAPGTIKSRVSRARARLSELLSISGNSDLGADPVMEAASELHRAAG